MRSRGGFPLIETLAAFLAANFVFSRFEKVARSSVAKGLMDGLYDLRSDVETSRAGALRDVPREVRSRIRSEIDGQLAGAGITRSQARRVIGQIEEVRVVGRDTVEQLRRLL